MIMTSKTARMNSGGSGSGNSLHEDTQALLNGNGMRQNGVTHKHFVSSRGDSESIELANFGQRRVLRRQRNGTGNNNDHPATSAFTASNTSPSSSFSSSSATSSLPSRHPSRSHKHKSDDEDDYEPQTEEEAFVFHLVESHHNLQGISLQYRCTVEQLKRCNNLWTEEELHTHKTIRVPVPRHGILFNEPEAADEAGGAERVTTHTTRRTVGRSGSAPDLAKLNPSSANNIILIDPDTSDTTNEARSLPESPSSPTQFLDRLDRELQVSIQQQDDHEVQFELDDTASTALLIGPRSQTRTDGLDRFYPSDWRVVLAVVLAIVVGAPILFYLLEPYIVAAPPAT